MGHRATGKAGRRDEPEPEDLPRRGFAPQALESEQERGVPAPFTFPSCLGGNFLRHAENMPSPGKGQAPVAGEGEGGKTQ